MNGGRPRGMGLVQPARRDDRLAKLGDRVHRNTATGSTRMTLRMEMTAAPAHITSVRMPTMTASGHGIGMAGPASFATCVARVARARPTPYPKAALIAACQRMIA